MNTVKDVDSSANGLQSEARQAPPDTRTSAEEQSTSEAAAEKKYKLSTSNKLLMALAFIVYAGLFLAYSDKSPQQTTVFLASLLKIWLFPLFGSWFAWRLSGEKEGPASLTLNIVMGLVFVRQIDNLRNIIELGIY
jgi:hypothetical protein